LSGLETPSTAVSSTIHCFQKSITGSPTSAVMSDSDRWWHG
jgi:hypothetical protein